MAIAATAQLLAGGACEICRRVLRVYTDPIVPRP
jgi:hypothetical protein